MINHYLKFIVITLLLTYMINSSVQAAESEQQLTQLMQQHKGKVIYLDFWASWCVPCRKSFPWMNDMQAKYSHQNFVVISINLDAEKSLADEFLQQVPAEFAIIYDAKGGLAQKFKLKGMPSSYLFDREGQLISSHSGFNNKKKQHFEQEILKALK
jgi:thiol-disulfide isomerase/thioredoxin